MKVHGITLRWPLVVIALAVLAAHGLILPFVSTHAGLSATAIAAVIAVLVLKHIGLLGSLFAWARRRSRPR